MALLASIGVLHLLHQTLNLAGGHEDASRFAQMIFGLLVAGLVGSLQAYQASQSRSIAAFQPESSVRRIMALLFAGVIVVVALQRE